MADSRHRVGARRRVHTEILVVAHIYRRGRPPGYMLVEITNVFGVRDREVDPADTSRHWGSVTLPGPRKPDCCPNDPEKRSGAAENEPLVFGNRPFGSGNERGDVVVCVGLLGSLWSSRLSWGCGLYDGGRYRPIAGD